MRCAGARRVCSASMGRAIGAWPLGPPAAAPRCRVRSTSAVGATARVGPPGARGTPARGSAAGATSSASRDSVCGCCPKGRPAARVLGAGAHAMGAAVALPVGNHRGRKTVRPKPMRRAGSCESANEETPVGAGERVSIGGGRGRAVGQHSRSGRRTTVAWSNRPVEKLRGDGRRRRASGRCSWPSRRPVARLEAGIVERSARRCRYTNRSNSSSGQLRESHLVARTAW